MNERIDFSVDIGPWAFRRLACTTVPSTLQTMDEHGIGLAITGPVPGITYRNCHAANEELAEQIEAHSGARERLLQAGVLNPMYPGLAEDFRRCAEDIGCRGLKLYPNYHGYQCWRSESVELCQWAAAAEMPVIVVVRVEDERLHHWQMLVPATPIEDILRLVEAVPEGKFVLSGANAAEAGKFLEGTDNRAECMVELSYVKGPMNAIETIVAGHGSERLLYGTHLPFVYPAANTEKIIRSRIPEQEKRAIFCGNARRLLGL